MKCPDCGGPLGPPSMMDGNMRCLECGDVWDGEWLCRFQSALSKFRAALTVADVTLPPCDCHAWGTRKPPCPTCKARRSIKAARTAMDKAQGRSK